MSSLVIPDLSTVRSWLTKLEVPFYECGSCEALHLSNFSEADGILDTKIDISKNVLIFSAAAEVRPVALIPLVADLSQINAFSLTAKAFLDVQDDQLPKLVVCQTLSLAAGVSFEQFHLFIQQSEEQVGKVMMEAVINNVLLESEEEEILLPEESVRHQLH